MLATRLVLIGAPDPKSFHCYFVYTFCKDRIQTFLILILILILSQQNKDIKHLGSISGSNEGANSDINSWAKLAWMKWKQEASVCLTCDKKCKVIKQ